MKIMTIQVPDDSVEFVEEFVERIGGNVEEKALIVEPKKEKKVKVLKKEMPLDSFGVWTDIDLDTETYREKLRRKTPQF